MSRSRRLRLADVAMLRAEPNVFGPVASDSTVPRLIDALAAATLLLNFAEVAPEAGMPAESRAPQQRR